MLSSKNLSKQDVGNIVALEHVNLFIPDRRLSELFYISTLGLTRDPYVVFESDNIWVNIGDQQLHLPARGTQVLPGHIGLVMPDLDALIHRLDNVSQSLRKTKFSWSKGRGYVSVTGPWGNKFRCHSPSAKFGTMSLGISYLELSVRIGTAIGISRFYEEVLRAPVSITRSKNQTISSVKVNTHQALVFRETSAQLSVYDGHHIAIYVANFSEPYRKLDQLGLIMPGNSENQYRFKNIVDPKNGDLLTELEHEVRSMAHPMYKRELVNRNPEQSFANYARGHQDLSPISNQ